MKDIEDILQKLERLAARAMERNPHSAGVVSAFRPLIMARARLVDSLDLSDGGEFTLDENLFRQGIPVARQNAWFREDDPFAPVALSLIPPLKTGFPDLNSTWERFTGLIDDKKIFLPDFFRSYPAGGDDLLASWAQLLEADVRIPAFLASSVARVILERRALDWAGLMQDFEWEKGYCPLCGSPPNISKHLEGTGQRWLHCPRCNHEWRFRRVVCPCCENDDQKTMSYFTIDEKEQESAFGCEMCKSYLVTVLKVSGSAEFDPDIAALSLSHIDIIMQEKGYLPMVQPEWSTFA